MRQPTAEVGSYTDPTGGVQPALVRELLRRADGDNAKREFAFGFPTGVLDVDKPTATPKKPTPTNVAGPRKPIRAATNGVVRFTPGAVGLR